MAPIPAVLCCPDCGAPMTLTIAVDSISARARSTSKALEERTGTRTDTSGDCARASAPRLTRTDDTRPIQGLLPALPRRATAMAKASLWKRALAIAHRCLDEEPDAASQTEAFKRLCAAQGIDYGVRGLHGDGRPLYARALDYAERHRRPHQRGIA